jgi:hypothetical protein
MRPMALTEVLEAVAAAVAAVVVVNSHTKFSSDFGNG